MADADKTKEVKPAPIVVDDIEFETQEKADQYNLAMAQVKAIASAPDLSPRLPEGFTVRTPTLLWRDSIYEVPMNETHLPDSSAVNPYYDREWIYIWAYGATSIAEKRSKGFYLPSYKELERMVAGGKCPEHFLGFLREEGTYVMAGDLVLMRQPRVWRKEQEVLRTQRALNAIRQVDKEGENKFAEMGVSTRPSPVGNEINIRF